MILAVAVLGLGAWLWFLRPEPELDTKFVQEAREEAAQMEEASEEADDSLRSVTISQPGNYYLLQGTRQVYQTFNNCGPATLSMILSWYGKDVSQAELGDKMRPFQNPQGDNDDKTIFTSEFTQWARNYGLEAMRRPNGDLELLKKFISNDIPIVVKTWLKVDDDIGHFRVVRGFDDSRGVIIQDDSYHGPNKKISYFDFLSMWQPFNYDYIVVFDEGKREVIEAIIGSEMDEAVAWQNALERARKERELDPQNIYPVFNMAVAYYHLGEFENSVQAFEEVEARLPRRMLWYQIEPIRAYRELGNYSKVFKITERILENGNRAFSELYQIRGEIYLEQGKADQARQEFELALKYNEHFSQAKASLEGL